MNKSLLVVLFWVACCFVAYEVHGAELEPIEIVELPDGSVEVYIIGSVSADKGVTCEDF